MPSDLWLNWRAPIITRIQSYCSLESAISSSYIIHALTQFQITFSRIEWMNEWMYFLCSVSLFFYFKSYFGEEVVRDLPHVALICFKGGLYAQIQGQNSRTPQSTENNHNRFFISANSNTTWTKQWMNKWTVVCLMCVVWRCYRETVGIAVVFEVTMGVMFCWDVIKILSVSCTNLKTLFAFLPQSLSCRYSWNKTNETQIEIIKSAVCKKLLVLFQKRKNRKMLIVTLKISSKLLLDVGCFDRWNSRKSEYFVLRFTKSLNDSKRFEYDRNGSVWQPIRTPWR